MRYNQNILLRFTAFLLPSNFDEKVTINEKKVTSNQQNVTSNKQKSNE